MTDDERVLDGYVVIRRCCQLGRPLPTRFSADENSMRGKQDELHF